MIQNVSDARRVLLDTTVLSDFLDDQSRDLHDTPVCKFVNNYLEKYGVLEFSVVTRFEIRRGLIHRELKKKLLLFNALCFSSNIVSLDAGIRGQKAYRDIWGHAENLWGTLAKQGKIMGDADLLIAATAQVYSFTVATRDDDFDLVHDIIHVIKIPRQG